MKNKRTNQDGRGGARAGAGRKPKGRVQWVVRVEPAVKDAAQQKAREQGQSDSDYVEDVVKRDVGM